MMHSFSLLVGSLLGHPWAKDIIKRAQRMVTYFNASTRAHSLLMESAKNLGISGQLQSSNTTRFTSVHIMLQSVVKMDQPLHAVLNRHPDQIKDKQGEVKLIIADRQFWAATEVLSTLLEPFSQVVMAIQSQTANLADTTRYWLYLARSFKAELPKLTHVGGETFI
jgi:3-methyladenine DNA glycosylase/8-oxoguanine DNA glycosylase